MRKETRRFKTLKPGFSTQKQAKSLHLRIECSLKGETPGKLTLKTNQILLCLTVSSSTSPLHLLLFPLFLQITPNFYSKTEKHTESIKIEELTQPFPLPLFLLLLPLSSSLNHSSSWWGWAAAPLTTPTKGSRDHPPKWLGRHSAVTPLIQRKSVEIWWDLMLTKVAEERVGWQNKIKNQFFFYSAPLIILNMILLLLSPWVSHLPPRPPLL